VIYSFVRLSVATMQGTDAGSGLGCHGKAPRLLLVCSGIDLLTGRHRSCVNVVCLEGGEGLQRMTRVTSSSTRLEGQTQGDRSADIGAGGRGFRPRIGPGEGFADCGRDDCGDREGSGQISARAPDRARQPAGRRHHAGVLAGMGASTVLQLPDRRSRRVLALSAGA